MNFKVSWFSYCGCIVLGIVSGLKVLYDFFMIYNKEGLFTCKALASSGRITFI